jgi:thiosulfate/3-mercaptopyruvate sulfurtransferase
VRKQFERTSAMIRLFLTSAATVALVAPAFAADLAPLIAPDELRAVDNAIILDVRGEDYAEGHIEGAIDAPYGLFRGPADNPGALVPVDVLETTLEDLGLSQDRPIIIVTQGATDTDFGSAARVYWTLKSSGFPELSILNGGAQAWVNSGLPVTKAVTELEPTELDITWDNSWTADTADVAATVAGDHEAILVDARPAAFFEGKQAHAAAARPGTLPGAQNLEYTRFFQPGATAISTPTDIDALLAEFGVKDGEDIVSFCNTGHWAATNWFAMSELAGIDNVKLYPGSMVEYSTTDGEMENQPSLLQNLLGQFDK